MKNKLKNKRIMRKFKLNEISAVDVPAQSPALATIMKRCDLKDVKTETVIHSELKKEASTMTTEATKDVEKLLKSLEERLNRAEMLSKMSDAEKSAFDKMDEAEQELWIAAGEEERKKMMASKMQEPMDLEKRNDQVLFKDSLGNEFLKSDDPRLVQLAKRADEDRKNFIKEKARNENIMLTKRAESEFSNLPGDVKTHVAILKALGTIKDDSVREASFNVLKAQNESLSKCYETLGNDLVTKYSEHSISNPEQELDRLAKEYAKKENVNYYDAYDVISNDNAELVAKALNKN